MFPKNFLNDTDMIQQNLFHNSLLRTKHGSTTSIPSQNKKAVLSQRWPRDVRYISRSWAVAEIWSFEITQDGGGRHPEFVRIENSAIRSAVPENPTLHCESKKLGHFFTAYNFRNIEQIFTKFGTNQSLFILNIVPEFI